MGTFFALRAFCAKNRQRHVMPQASTARSVGNRLKSEIRSYYNTDPAGCFQRITKRPVLKSPRSTGYGVVMPDTEQMHLEEPQIVRQGGKYSVKLKANAPAIHMFMTNVETEVTPAIGGESASEDIINFLLQGFDGDINRIWQSNIFGKSLNDIAEEGLMAKIEALPVNARFKLRETMERVINEGSGGLICILL